MTARAGSCALVWILVAACVDVASASRKMTRSRARSNVRSTESRGQGKVFERLLPGLQRPNSSLQLMDMAKRAHAESSSAMRSQLPRCEEAQLLGVVPTTFAEVLGHETVETLWDCLRCQPGYREKMVSFSRSGRAGYLWECVWKPCGDLCAAEHCDVTRPSTGDYWKTMFGAREKNWDIEYSCSRCAEDPLGPSVLINTVANVMEPTTTGSIARVTKICAASLERVGEGDSEDTETLASMIISSLLEAQTSESENATSSLHSVRLAQAGHRFVRAATAEYRKTDAAEGAWKMVSDGSKYMDTVLERALAQFSIDEVAMVGQFLARSSQVANLRGALELCVHTAFGLIGRDERDDAYFNRVVSQCDSIDNFFFRLHQAAVKIAEKDRVERLREVPQFNTLQHAARSVVDIAVLFGAVDPTR